METIIDSNLPLQKIYKDKAIYIGTFIGGPLVAGYLMAENFKVFNEATKAKKAWLYAIVTTIIAFGAAFLIHDTGKIPNQLIPLLYTGLAFYLVKYYQGEKIKAHLDEGGPFYKWRPVGVGLIGLVVTILPFLLFVVFTDPALTATSKTYGSLRHEILFDKGNISENEVNLIAKGLEKTTFFDEEQQKSIFVKKEANIYVISVFIVENSINDTAVTLAFNQLRMDMQSLFPDNKIVINLCIDNVNDVKKRLD